MSVHVYGHKVKRQNYIGFDHWEAIKLLKNE